jgi:hypothetical protein
VKTLYVTKEKLKKYKRINKKLWERLSIALEDNICLEEENTVLKEENADLQKRLVKLTDVNHDMSVGLSRLHTLLTR